MEEINLEEFKDYKNVTIAQYKAAIENAKENARIALKNGKSSDALKYYSLSLKLSRLLNKRTSYGNKHGYDNTYRRR